MTATKLELELIPHPDACDEFTLLTVIGVPMQQGDKSAVIVGGKARVIEGNTTAMRERRKSWRSTVTDAGREARAERGEAWDGPIRVDVLYRFPMPGNRRAADRRRGWRWKDTAPDADKLDRSLRDGLTQSGLIADDARISDGRSRKIEVVAGEWTGALVVIRRVDPYPDEVPA